VVMLDTEVVVRKHPVLDRGTLDQKQVLVVVKVEIEVVEVKELAVQIDQEFLLNKKQITELL